MTASAERLLSWGADWTCCCCCCCCGGTLVADAAEAAGADRWELVCEAGLLTPGRLLVLRVSPQTIEPGFPA